MQSPPSRQEDLALVQGCLAGDQLAWHTLVQRFHKPVATTIALQLGTRPNTSRSDEVLCDFWHFLWEGNSRWLRPYDPRRSGLATYLRHLARWKARWWLLEQVRRAKRLTLRPVIKRVSHDSTEALYELWEQLWANATAGEQHYLEGLLNPVAGACPAGQPTPPWERKVKQRVRAKLQQLLGSEPEHQRPA